ncbi:MAG: hypothetical protein LBL54_01865 [Clostridiales Family XIII bacterium]|jgi:hypothetical protein|nr:hypothetical protein [Clostridiales Family XIII bacterium]
MVDFTKRQKKFLKWQTAVICALCVCVGLGGSALVDVRGGDEGQSTAAEYVNMYDRAVGKDASDAVNTKSVEKKIAPDVSNENVVATEDASGVENANVATTEGAVGVENANVAAEDGSDGKKTTLSQSEPEKKDSKKKNKKKSGSAKKYKTKVKATWYTGDVLGFRGSYGKLTNGNTIALNASQRSELGVAKKETVYLDFPGDHENLSGKYKVMDSGCSSGVVDLFYASKGSVPKKFKRAGVVRGVKLYRYD